MGLGSSSEKVQQTTTPPLSPKRFEKDEVLKSIPIRKKSNRLSTESSPILIMSPIQEREYVKFPLTGESSLQETAQFPTVFSWNHGGQDVYLIGTFTNWKEKISMKQSHNDFTCIQTLEPGTYYYRYIVDGKWQTDPSQPMITDMNGEVNNVIEIKEQKKEDTIFAKKFVSPSPPGTYGNYFEDLSDKQSPPSLPPHLLRALLNTAPPSADPTLLPLPHHVMLNHLYSLPRKDEKMMIVGFTQRYKQKFVTTVFYKALDTQFPHSVSSLEFPALRITDSSDNLLVVS